VRVTGVGEGAGCSLLAGPCLVLWVYKVDTEGWGVGVGE
jgi:hypothetical protein